jgi:hypothetical protein
MFVSGLSSSCFLFFSMAVKFIKQFKTLCPNPASVCDLIAGGFVEGLTFQEIYF